MNTLLEMIETLLAYIRASRNVRSARDADGKHVGFANYMKAMEALQPWLAASDRLLYLRVMEAQLQIFKSVEHHHGADVMQALESGATLGIQRKADAFSAIWNDLHLEQETNATAKRLLTLAASRHASLRSRITALPSSARTSQALNALVPKDPQRARTPSKKTAKPPIPLAPKRMGTDRLKLSKVVESLDVVCDCTPGAGNPSLMRHFTSGIAATPAVVEALSSVKEVGQEKVTLYSHNSSAIGRLFSRSTMGLLPVFSLQQ